LAKRQPPPIPKRRAEQAPVDAEESDGSKYFAGDVIASKYQLTSIIGEGGMGAVWLARNLTLDADVCVKLLRREIATPQASQRLLQEARAAARLSHPSIVRVFDFGETEQRDPFIVMELLRGDSLRRLMSRKTRLPAAHAVATLLPVASALAEAHAKGIVHRDLKPENIVLVSEESGAVIPKVVDFGVAKVRREGAARGLTQDGSVLGSPDYMSPEQAQGRGDVDQRADVWAFSVMLYEVSTGCLPFTGDNYNALLWAIQKDEPRPMTDFAAGDAELWSIVQKGLSKEPAARWKDMRELGTALAEWAVKNGADVDVTGSSIALSWLMRSRRTLSEAPDTALRAPSFADLEEGGLRGEQRGVTTAPERRAQPRRRNALAIAAAAVTGLALAGVVVWLVARPGAGQPETGATASTPPMASSPSPAASAPEPPASSAHAASAPGIDASMAGCLRPLLPKGSLADSTDGGLGFLCKERDPRVGSSQLRTFVVESRGKGVTPAMKEWAHLSWYELAVFAVARARCCPSAPALSLPSNGGVCAPLDTALDALGRAVAADRDVAAALGRFDQSVLCLLAKGGAGPYQYTLARLDGARAEFQKTLDRAHASPPRR